MRKLIVLSLLLVSVSWAVIAQATSFNPLGEVTVKAPTTAGANADVVTHVQIPAPDAYFSSLVTFYPPEWGIARDADVPDGAWVAHLLSNSTLGLLNSHCLAKTVVNFELLDATTNKSNSFTYNRTTEAITGKDFPGYDIMPSGLERIVEQWPAFLDDIPQLAGKQPIARYAAHSRITTTEESLQILVYAPGDIGPAERGYGSVTVLQDPSPGPAAPASITDNCTKMETFLTVFGTSMDNPNTTAVNEAGYSVRTNPTCGGPDFTFSWEIKSQMDADDDGIENQLDSCPENPKPAGYDPRAIPPLQCDPPQPGDQDCDGIDDSCDLVVNDWTDFNFSDNDNDGFLNRGDNCPTVYNPDNADSDADGIGDVCDSTPNSPSGHKHEAIPEDSVTISGADQPCPGTADLKIVGQYLVNPPSTITMSQDVLVTLNKVIHNNGPAGPVDARSEAVVTAPPGCTVRPTHVAVYSNLPVSVDVVASEPFLIHCYQPSSHTFAFDNSIDVTTPGVADPNLGNNTAHTELTVAAVTQTDVKIVGETFTVRPPEPLPLNTDVDVTLRKTIHNNGPYGPVDIANDGKVWPPRYCTAAPKNVPPLISGVPVSTDVVVDEVWTIRCSEPGVHSFAFDNWISVATAHVSDSNPANNIAHLELRDDAAAVDTDRDGLTNDGDDDDDNDGFADLSEVYVSTDPLDACPDDPSDAAWPPDQDNSGTITFVGDENRYAGRMFTAVTCPSADPDCRLDLDTSGVITFVGDENRYAGRMFDSCQ